MAEISPIRIAHVTTSDVTLRFILLENLRRFCDEGLEVIAISAPGRWVRELESTGIRHIPWPHATRAWDPRSDARAFLELLAIFSRERFDLVHTHNPKPGVMGRIAARLAGVPCVVNTVHGFYATPEDPFAKRSAVLTLERLAALCSDLELYQSAEDLKWARRLGVVSTSKGMLLGDGGPLSRFDPATVPSKRVRELRAQLGISPDALVVGTVGRLVAEKGYREFIAAAHTVRMAFPQAVFLAVGDRDPAKPDALSGAEIEAASADVIFTGLREDVRDLLALMDVFVLASWREGLPRSALEAAAMSVPLVLTDIRGCREIVRSDEEGILVPPRDAGALARAIVELLGDPKRRERMSSVLRARTLERFDERKVAETLTRAYADLLARKGLQVPANKPDEPRIRRARPGDAAAIAQIHAQSLRDAFLPRLGTRFLEQLYRALAKDPEATVLVAENGRPVGFAAGVVSVRRFYKRFAVRYCIRAAFAAAPYIVRGGILSRLSESARYPLTARNLPESELLAIALLPGFRGSGVGSALARGVIGELSDQGAVAIKVVAGERNEDANDFYRSLGFRLVDTVSVHDGATSNVWVR